MSIVAPIWDPERRAAHARIEIRFGRIVDMPCNAARLTQERFFSVGAPVYHGSAVDLGTARLLGCAGPAGSWGVWLIPQGMPFQREGEVTLTSTFVIAIEAARHGAGLARL